MGLIFRKTRTMKNGTRVNMSKSGVSASKKFGPLTVNSRGRMTLRLGKGMSWRIR
jgi:hypothetical protein